MTLRRRPTIIASRHALGRSVKLPAGRSNCHSVPTTGPIRDLQHQASKQGSVFLTEEQGRTTECTEKQGCWRFAQEFDRTSREAQPLAYSVDSIVLPCSSVIKTLDFLLSIRFCCTII